VVIIERNLELKGRSKVESLKLKKEKRKEGKDNAETQRPQRKRGRSRKSNDLGNASSWK
jgi:hypothetical protein